MKYESLKDWKYRILKTFSIQTSIIPDKTVQTRFATLTVKGRLYIKKGFCWDGASGAIDTDTIMKPSCLHDWGCAAYLDGLITNEMRCQFDDLFHDLCIKSGMSRFRAELAYKAVKVNTKIRYGIR